MISALFGPGATVLAISIVVVLAVNLRTVRRPSASSASADELPMVSVLIPARNESSGIARCVEAVLAQTGVRFEVIVVDDRSDDDTLARARAIHDPRLLVVRGAPLPDGWTGKNWACHQLASRARGEVLCFVDADTHLAPTALRAALDTMIAERADLVTSLVAAEYSTPSQAVLLPIVNHALLAMFPVPVMHSPRFSKVALALGPFLLVGSTAYAAVGGHAANHGDVVDDVSLCRAIKAVGGRVRLVNGTSLVSTAWYPDTRSIWNGFSKNAFGALDSNWLVAMATCLLLVPMLTVPFLRVGAGLVHGDVPLDAALSVALLLTARLITSLAGRDPLWTVPLHPVAVVFWGSTLAHSAWLAQRDATIEWRGREVPIASR